MLKLWFVLLGLYLFTATVLAENKEEIYSKFHQNDYDFTLEWTELVRFTQPEVKELKLNVFKFNRTATALNITATFNIDVGNQLEVIVQLHKFSSNEYRPFPLRVQINLCKAIQTDIVGMGEFITCGNFTGCPFRKGRTYHICNWAPDQRRFPPYIPTGRYMAECQAMYRNKELFVMRGYAAASRSILNN